MKKYLKLGVLKKVRVEKIMKKGLTSLDAITAFIILLFLIIFIQKTTSVNLSVSDDYGALMQARSISIKLSSVIDSFYATMPSANDNITKINGLTKVKFFGQHPFILQIKKQSSDYIVNTSIITPEKNYSATFPAVNEIQFIQNQGAIK